VGLCQTFIPVAATWGNPEFLNHEPDEFLDRYPRAGDMCPIQVNAILWDGDAADVPVGIGEPAVPGQRVPVGADDRLGLRSGDLVDVFTGSDAVPSAPLGLAAIKRFELHPRPEQQSVAESDRGPVVQCPRVGIADGSNAPWLRVM
jgi:hypothetical protein